MIEFLRSTPLFHGLTEHEMETIAPLLRSCVYEKGTFIIQEGESGNVFYLIKTGAVEVLKRQGRDGPLHQVSCLGAKEWFGEMAFLGGGVRESTIRTLEETEVIEIPIAQFFKQAEEYSLASKMSVNFAREISRLLKMANEKSVKSIERQLHLSQAHDHMGRLLVYLFILLTLFFYAVKLREQAHSMTVLVSIMDSSLILGVGLCGWFLVKQSHYPLEFYGVTLKNGWRHAKEGFLWTLPLLIAMLGLKWVLITFVSDFKTLDLISVSQHTGFFLSFFDPSQAREATERFWTLTGIYVALVPLQEFIARGCLQGFLTRFFTSSHRVVLAIMASNLLFGLFHGFRTIAFSLVAALLGCFWGWIYHKQGSLIGAIVSHALVGVWALGFLNYQSILV